MACTGSGSVSPLFEEVKDFRVLEYLHASPPTTCQFRHGLCTALPVSFRNHCKETQDRPSAGEKAAACGRLGKTTAEGPASGRQGPESRHKLPAERLRSTQNGNGWFAKTQQISRFSFPLCLQEIDTIALATSYYILGT